MRTYCLSIFLSVAVPLHSKTWLRMCPAGLPPFRRQTGIPRDLAGSRYVRNCSRTLDEAQVTGVFLDSRWLKFDDKSTKRLIGRPTGIADSKRLPQVGGNWLSCHYSMHASWRTGTGVDSEAAKRTACHGCTIRCRRCRGRRRRHDVIHCHAVHVKQFVS